jgi:nitrogen fixation/metabolism regulation signal transduction histidine kinase
VVVFDDISDVISANRSVAWAEVARRMAHEIKNPLTPIQLSAERLAMKLMDKLEPKDAALLERSTNTIVNQVSSLKHMVEEFREYARTPPLVFGRVDLNKLVEDVLTLYGWDPAGDATQQAGVVRFAAKLSPDLPHVRGDTTQLRQVVHNLLANARDALVETTSDGVITVATETIAASIGEQSGQPAVRLTVTDNGPGFSAQLLQRAFEPYVTTKTHGTGLGLAIVRKIVEEHGGYIDISNHRTGGARITILLAPVSSEVDGDAQANDNNETQ